jgi:prepilin-type N-terminal cleavage/methylation domain-containing protein
LIRRLLIEERGYSLVEVMVSIMILAIAIIPMVGMFDMGLKSATTGSNYDKARALADSNLEKVRSLPYSTATATYKPVNAAPTAGTPVSCDSGIFDCEVTTTYVNDDLNASSTAINRMRVEVLVQWDSNKSYTTTGLKTK